MTRETPDEPFEDDGSDGKGRPRVLVVDDEPELADLFVTMLAPEFEATAVYSGEDAIEAIDETIDVVLLDRRMPKFTGEEVLEEIRAKDIDCRAVMVTGIDPTLDAIDAPFDEYLEKPVGRDELRETVRTLTCPEPCQDVPG